MTRATLAETPSPNWTPDQPIVRIADVHKSFGTFEVLKGISFDVRKGEVVCIIGPSGSGKSTLIRCINALVPVTAGSIEVEGIDVTDPRLDKLALRRKVGMVFQQYNLFPHRTALQNVMMAPVHVLGQNKAEVEERAYALLKKVRLEGKEHAYPGELSGGQQQRVAIARAFAAEPDLLVCDEITSALDASVQVLLLDQLAAMQRRAGTAMLLITHDLSVVWRMAGRVVVMRHGRILEHGETDAVFRAPENAYTAALLGAATRATRVSAAAIEPPPQCGRPTS